MQQLPLIPGYHVESRLGEGGMAKVYFGLQKKLNRRVAIKVMESFLLKDENFSRRFLKEAETAANLNHPNIVTIYDVGQVGDDYYMVMEYLEGTLKDRIHQMRNEGRLMKPPEAVRILKSIATALAYAHENGYIHRDIKPDNIMFRNGETPVLVDFGIAKAIGATTKLTKTGMSIGTPHYMSPEQIRGLELDGRADLYSLGVLFYEMLTGEVPYKATDYIAVVMKHLNEPVPELPGELRCYQPLLNQLMAKDREQRLSSGKDLIRILKHPESVPEIPPASGEPLSPTIVSPRVENDPIHSIDFSTGKKGKAPGRRRLRIAVLTVLLAVTVTALLVVLRPWEMKSTPSPTTANEILSPPDQDLSENFTKDPVNSDGSDQNKKTVDLKKKNESESPAGSAVQKDRKQEDQSGEADSPASPDTSRRRPGLSIAPTSEGDKAVHSRQQDISVTRKPKSSKANRPPEKKTAPSTSGPEETASTPPVAENKPLEVAQSPVVKMIHVPAELVRGYIGRMDRIVVNLLPRGVKVTGSLTVELGILANGQVRVVKALDASVRVIPKKRVAMVRRLIINRLNSMKLSPPRDKSGKSVSIQDWRLSYRVGTYEGRIILKRRF